MKHGCPHFCNITKLVTQFLFQNFIFLQEFPHIRVTLNCMCLTSSKVPPVLDCKTSSQLLLFTIFIYSVTIYGSKKQTSGADAYTGTIAAFVILQSHNKSSVDLGHSRKTIDASF